MLIEIRGRDLPAPACCGYTDVAVGVQRGREVVDVRPVGAGPVAWAFDVPDVHTRDGAPDVRGPYVHGRPGGRFLYLSWAGAGPTGVGSRSGGRS